MDPGVIRDRFLSEFALALVEGVQLQEFLDWSVAQIGRILEVDRFTLFLFGPGPPGENLAVRTSWAADGVDSDGNGEHRLGAEPAQYYADLAQIG